MVAIRAGTTALAALDLPEGPDAVEELRSACSNPLIRRFPGTVVVFDDDLRILSVGGLDAAELDLSPERVEGHTFFDVVDHDLAVSLEKPCRSALAGKDVAVDLVQRDRVYRYRFGSIRDGGGRIVAGMASVRNVTESRRSEQALRDSQMQFRAAFRHGPIGMSLLDLNGRCLQANSAMCDLTGYTEGELCGRVGSDLTHPDDVDADRAAMNRLLAGEVASSTLEKRFITAAGEVIWVSKSASLVRRHDGSPLHFICQFEDITERRGHERLLALERRRLRDAQSIGHIGSWEMDVTTHAVTWSDTLLELYGLDPNASERDLETALQRIHPDDVALVESGLAECASTGAPFYARHRAFRTDGEMRWFDARGARHQEGSDIRIAGSVVDVTDQLRAEAEIRDAHAFGQAVMNASPDIIFVYDLVTRSNVWANRSLADVLGYRDDRLADAELARALDALVPDAWEAGLDAAGADRSVLPLTHRFHRADGSTCWFSQRLTPLHRDADGRVTQLVGVLRDVTADLAAEERLEHSALHDDLTGLPNRRLVTDRLGRALERSERMGQVVVFFCDLDGFKRVNDTHGHHAGDAVLVTVAARMMGATRRGDTVGRMGGDEFVAICAVYPGDDPAHLGDVVARRIEMAVSEPIVVDGTEHRVTVSAGIRVADQGEDAGTVLRDADAAMYLAKTRGKNGHATFEAGLQAEALDRARIEQQIRRSLTDDTIEVFYQPIVEPRSGRVHGFEALLRVPDGAGGHLDTVQAVSVAEQTGIIAELDGRVLRRACAQVAAWRRQPGHADLALTVNRSASEISRPGFYDRIAKVAASVGLDSRALTVEITETVLLELAEHTVTDLHRLRADGIGIAIDDFGTGYASLRYLAALPISGLKVDRSFTAGLPDDPTATTILRATAGLAADLGMGCVVEGVETVEQLAALPDSPGLLVQGYLFAPPEAARPYPPTHLAPKPTARLGAE